MKPITPARLLVFIFSAAAIFASCYQEGGDSHDYPPLTYTITCTGSTHAGDMIQFTCDIPADKQILWVFGDSTTSTEPSPKHTFLHPGVYNVIIVVNGDTGNLKGKNPSKIIFATRLFDDGAMTANMAGTRHCHVVKDSMNYNMSWYRADTIATYDDTLGITVINDTTIVVKGDTLRDYYDRITGIYDHYNFIAPYTAFAYKIVLYYFDKDSVVCFYHPYQGGIPGSGKRPEQIFGVTTRYYSY